MIDEAYLNEPTDPSWPKIGDMIQISWKQGGDDLEEVTDTGKVLGYGVLEDMPVVQLEVDRFCCCSDKLTVIMRVDLL